MNYGNLYPCGRIARRRFLFQAGGGFFGAALGALWSEEGKIQNAALGPHFTPKAKSVIFLFMCGGVSHIDTFDPKDNKWAGKLIDAIGFGDNVAEMKRPVIPCLRTFTRYGKSGIPVSDFDPSNPEHKYIRLYVGLEEADYLIKDLDQAFEKMIK